MAVQTIATTAAPKAATCMNRIPTSTALNQTGV
jgi:hypothetical protein